MGDRAYLTVLACAGLCYAALGAVLRLLPSYVPGPLGPLAAASGAGNIIVPAFAAGVIAARVLGAAVPDRFGARPTLVVSALVAAAGLAAVAGAPGIGGVLVATVVLAVGQALAVPALGLLALSGVPASAQGAAAGSFFAFFDLGVGLGGPLAGRAAHVIDADGALIVAAIVVALTPLVAGVARAQPRPRATAGA